jgi:hypothetical protein
MKVDEEPMFLSKNPGCSVDVDHYANSVNRWVGTGEASSKADEGIEEDIDQNIRPAIETEQVAMDAFFLFRLASGEPTGRNRGY